MSRSILKVKSIWADLWSPNTSIFCIPWIVSFVITAYLICGVKITQTYYGKRCCILAVLITAIWTVLFIWHQRSLAAKKTEKMFIACNPVVVIFLSLVMGMFLAHIVWNSGYLSLMPYERIDNGTQHIDTLFHSSIAESWRRSGYPSTLLNNEEYLPYHTFSHLILGIIAGIMKMPAFISYNFLYPVLFLPLYCMAILFAVACAKYYFEDDFHVSFLDLIAICFFIFGINTAGTYWISKVTYTCSESFLTANTLSFFSYGLTFYALKKFKDNKKKLLIYCIVCLPMEIFVISWAKISVGFLFTAGVMYVAFRKGIAQKFILWLLDLLYFGDFMLALSLFVSHTDKTGNSTTNLKISWLPLDGQLGVGKLGMGGALHCAVHHDNIFYCTRN